MLGSSVVASAKGQLIGVLCTVITQQRWLNEKKLPVVIHSAWKYPPAWLLLFTGALPIPLQLRPEGSAEKPAAGGPDQAFREPQERSERYQEPQVVRYHRLDRHLPEKGRSPAPNPVVMCTCRAHRLRSVLIYFTILFVPLGHLTLEQIRFF